jgi:hypothetical protein
MQPRLIKAAPWQLSSRPAKLQYTATQSVKEFLTLYKSQVFQYAEIYANRHQRKRTFHGKSTHLPQTQQSNRVKRIIILPALQVQIGLHPPDFNCTACFRSIPVKTGSILTLRTCMFRKPW